MAPGEVPSLNKRRDGFFLLEEADKEVEFALETVEVDKQVLPELVQLLHQCPVVLLTNNII